MAGKATDDRRDVLGEKLYNKISAFQPELAGKITGMLLDSMEADEAEEVLKSDWKLRGKVEEAMKLLDGAGSSKPSSKQKSAAKAPVNGHAREDGSALRATEKELLKVKGIRDSLEAELREAEQWAEEMQKEWDEKERRWKAEADDLRKRAEAAEKQGEKAAAERDEALRKSMSNQASAQEAAKVAQQVKEAEARLKAMKTEGKGAEERLEVALKAVSRLEDELKVTRLSAEESKASAKETEQKGRKVEKAKAAAESAEAAVRKEVSVAEKWCDDMVRKFRVEIAQKDEEIEKAEKSIADLRQKLAEAQAPGGAKKQDKAAASSPQGNEKRLAELTARLKQAEAEAEAEKHRADAAERKSKETKATLDEAVEKKQQEARLKTERCRALQQDLENANRELKSYKDQLKQKGEGKDAAALLANAQRETKQAKEERQRVEQNLTQTKREINQLKKQIGQDVGDDASEAPAPAKKAPKRKDLEEEKEEAEPVSPAAKDPEEEDEEEEADPTSPPSKGGAKGSTPKASKAGAAQAKAVAKKKGPEAASASGQKAVKKKTSTGGMQVGGAQVVAVILGAIIAVQACLLVSQGFLGSD